MPRTNDKRVKLSPGDRLDIHHRYYNRLRSGETVTEIAADYDVARQWVAHVAREVEQENARRSDQQPGKAATPKDPCDYRPEKHTSYQSKDVAA
jgi:hypothetical protein